MGPNGISMNRQKILVVDDEHHYFLKQIEERLKSRGYDVSVAFGSGEAIQRVQNEKPDLVLLDIMMKQMEGSAFLQQMKRAGLIDNAPIVVLTLKAKMKEFFFVDGDSNYLAKPFNSKHLMEEIRLYLNARKNFGDKAYALRRARLN